MGIKIDFYADMFIYTAAGSSFYKFDILHFDAWAFKSSRMVWESAGIDAIPKIRTAFLDVKATKTLTFSKAVDIETDTILKNEFKHRKESTVLNPKAPIMDRELNPNRKLSTFDISFLISDSGEKFKQTLLFRIPTVINVQHTKMPKIGNLNVFTLHTDGQVEIIDG
jgi:hypothetical protein